jgi:hypothetical protein
LTFQRAFRARSRAIAISLFTPAPGAAATGLAMFELLKVIGPLLIRPFTMLRAAYTRNANLIAGMTPGQQREYMRMHDELCAARESHRNSLSCHAPLRGLGSNRGRRTWTS